jgi:hypothetical protein
MEYGYDLYVQERGKLLCEARVPQDLVEPHWKPIMDAGKDHCLILECEYIQGEVNFWRPIGIRTGQDDAERPKDLSEDLGEHRRRHPVERV